MTGTTHPFFGNQYSNGGYVIGSFKFPKGLTREVKDKVTISTKITNNAPIAKINSTRLSSNKVDKDVVSKAIKLNGNNKWIVPVVVLTVFVAGGSYLVYRFNKKKQFLEIPNIGICEHCEEPLIGSVFINDNIKPHIICKKCGKENFARYSEDLEEVVN